MFDDKEFWLKHPFNLISQFNILPKSENSLSKNLNNITRLVLIIFIILVIFKSKYSISFLVVSLVLIILVYLLFNKKDNDELLNEQINENKKSFYSNNNDSMSKNRNGNDKSREYYSDVKSELIVNNKGELCEVDCPNKPYVNGEFVGNKCGYMPYRISNEDLYQQGVNYSNTYNANDLDSDGSCCNMKNLNENKDYWTPKFYSPKVGTNPKSFETPHLSPRIVEEGYWSYPSATNSNTQVITDLSGEVDIYVDKKKYEKPECDNRSLLLQETPTRMYTEQELNQPNNQLFLTTIEPHVYSYDDRIIGINSNSGITYTEEDEPLVRNQVCTNAGENYPIYTANTPQFVRDDLMPLQEEFEPARSNWSTKQKGLVAGPGSLNFEDIYKDWPSTNTMNIEERTYLNCKNPKEGYAENFDKKIQDKHENSNNMRQKIVDRMLMFSKKEAHTNSDNNYENYSEMTSTNDYIDSDGTINYPNNDPENTYDPRQTGYGDLTRSYSNQALGQVNYYYSDINSHREPVFFTRSDVDHIMFHDPQGKSSPYYQKNSSLQDVKDVVEDDFLAKTSLFREDLMSLQMRKRNSEMIQLRISPLMRSQHTSSFPNKY
jgi:hypothetical protein